MSLEESIATLVEAVNANTDTLKAVLAAAPAGGSTTTTKATAKATTKKADAAETGAAANTVSEKLKKELGEWLGEFAKAEDKDNPDGVHPEVTARKAALKKAFDGLKVAKLGDINTAENVERLETWFGKAKVADKGFGEGRFAADPEPAGDAASGEDLDI